MKKFMKTVICMAGVLACFGFISQAKANIVKFDLDTEFSGATPPAGTGPWLEATFDDGDTAGSVDLKLEAKLSGTEYVSGFYFNFYSPTLNVVSLSITSTDTYNAIGQGSNAFKADGDGFFDVFIDFPTSGTDLLDNSDIYNFSITGTGITANMFDFYSFPGGGAGIWQAAAHVQGITGGFSGWIGPSEGFQDVPEPATMLLLGTGLVGVAGAARRRKKNQA